MYYYIFLIDDIIKISKGQKRQQGTRGRGTGQLRGRGQQQRGRGQQQRGRGQVLLRGTTGRGRGVVVRGRGTGAVARGRGKLVAQGQRNTQRGVGRGGTRGRGAPNTSVSPLNRNGLNQVCSFVLFLFDMYDVCMSSFCF